MDRHLLQKALVAVGGAAGAFSCQPKEKTQELPNIVFILADDLGW